MNNNEDLNNEEIDEKSVSSDNSQELFNLIQSIQTKLNSENTNEKLENKNVDNFSENTQENNINNNLDDLVENVVNNTKNIDNKDKNLKDTPSIDFSNISSLLQNVDIGSIINMFTNSNNNNSNNSSENNDSAFNGFDASTILKFQRILSSINKNDPKKNLLLSLKPFLSKSRQDKLNEYVTMLTIANAIEIFGSKGSDE